MALIQRLTVEHFKGVDTCDDEDGLRLVLDMRDDRDENEFWLRGDQAFPSLAIMVRGQDAAVHYFPELGHPGFLSQGGDRAGVSGFTCSNGERIELDAGAVVAVDAATNAALEFGRTLAPPTCLRWLELRTESSE